MDAEDQVRQLQQQLDAVSAKFEYEQQRQQVLLPYRIPRVRRGVIGTSRYAQRLRQSVRQASQLPQDSQRRATKPHANPAGNDGSRPSPIFIFGEPGLNKDNLAALIHFGSINRREPLIQVDCALLKAVDLVGRGDRPGLLEWLDRGTLILNNIQELPHELSPLVQQLLKTGAYQPLAEQSIATQPTASTAASLEDSRRYSPAWILMIAEKSLGQFAKPSQVIKVPPLRVRKADIDDQVAYYLRLSCKKRQQSQPELTPEALRRLQSYDFPGNLTELENLVERALGQQCGCTDLLTADVFWSVGSRTKRFRWNLLNAYPALRRFLNSDWWPTRINYGFTLGLYTLVVGFLLWGPQTRDTNFALNLFWAWWWPLILLSFPFVGRLWCSVCPFMIYGELVQTISLKLWPRELLPWPRKWADRWGGWILWAGFALILLWEELWHLENTAYLSGWLLIIITAGAIVCSLLFERRFWCRYLCPIGGMNGLFAKLSMTELRAQQGICAATCNTYHCYKGGLAEGEGQATGGCPVYSHPAQLTDNRNCVLCMTCLKACPHRSVEFNLRPPGIELWTSHEPLSYEVALLYLLAGAVLLHRLPEALDLIGWSPRLLDNFWLHAGISVVALVLPGAIAYLAQILVKLLPSSLKTKPFQTLSYGYLPLVLFASLAHYLHLGLTEGGQVVGIAATTFTAPAFRLHSLHEFLEGATTLRFMADPAVVAFLQGGALVAGALLSMVLTQKIAMQPLRKVIPQHLVILGATGLFWQLMMA